MEAIWGLDYDLATDKCYNRPCCPECEAPVWKEDDGKYRCVSCGDEIDVTDPDMIRWIDDRNVSKVEVEDCFVCHGKQCVETHYRKNHITLEWQAAWGKCNNCGSRFIV